MEEWQGSRSWSRSGDQSSGEPTPVSLHMSPKEWAQPLGRCGPIGTTLQALRVFPFNHSAIQPKGMFGTEILPKQFPTAPGCPENATGCP